MIAAFGFGLIEGQISLGNQRVEHSHLGTIADADADTDGDWLRGFADGKELAGINVRTKLLCQGEGLLGIGTGQKDSEFFAAIANSLGIGGLKALLDGFSGFAQAVISSLMANSVIIEFELGDINEHHRHGQLFFVQLLQAIGQLLQIPAVVQARERVNDDVLL